MRNRSTYLFGALLAVGALALILFGSRSAAAHATARLSPLVWGVEGQSGFGETTTQPLAATQAVSMTTDLHFVPDPITIAVGTTVTWTNITTNIQHTTTSDTAGIWDSGTVNPGNSFSVTFNTPGTFKYHCSFHQAFGMVGTITVAAPSETPTSTATITETPTITDTPTITTSPTITNTPNGSETATSNPTATATGSPTATPTATATSTPKNLLVGPHTLYLPVLFDNVGVALPTATLTPTPTGTPIPPSLATAVNYQFQPNPITILVGTTVIWTNGTTGTTHTVTADDGSFDSGLTAFSPGRTFSVTFLTPGSFAYYCQYHGGPGGQGMSGTIVVNPIP